MPVVGFFHGRSMKLRTLAAAGGAFAGVWLLEQGSSGAAASVSGLRIGEAWALISALLFGLQIYRIEHHTRR